MMGGNLVVTFRELSPAETDLCYKQTHLDRRAGKIDSFEDFTETLLRWRLCLQLVSVQTPEMLHSFPASAAEWAEGAPLESANETVLPGIMASLCEGVLKTESMFGLLGKELSRFNRLLVKLAANSHNENFWSATGQAS
jgi:hypothetical protein